MNVLDYNYELFLAVDPIWYSEVLEDIRGSKESSSINFNTGRAGTTDVPFQLPHHFHLSLDHIDLLLVVKELVMLQYTSRQRTDKEVQ